MASAVTTPRDLSLFAQLAQAIALVDDRMHTFAESELDSTVSDAILWRVSVIGQLAARLSEDARAAHPDVDWDSIRRLQLIAAGSLGGLTRDEVWRNVEFVLPALRVAAEHEASAKPADGPESGAAPPRILLIDDDPDIRRILDLLLPRAGYAVVEAADGEEGLELARTSVPDAVIADVQMPRLDGIQLVSRLREMPTFDHVPILLFTGKPPLADLDAALAMDQVRYMSKGDPKKVIKALREMLERGQEPRAVRDAP